MPQARRPFVELSRYETPVYDCSYLPGESAKMDCRWILSIDATRYEELLNRGWRRFGHDFFRPICRSCSCCKGIRVPVRTFQPSKSQRRIWRKNQSWQVKVQAPSISDEHLRIYNDYHAWMNHAKGWSHSPVSRKHYEQSFLAGSHDFAREFLYYDEGKLIAVGLVDWLPQALSSVYFFHAPDYRSRSPGVYSILYELEKAREAGLSFLYLGYWIRDCESMNYKSNYSPSELLDVFPDETDEASWRAFDKEDGEPSS